MSGSKTYENCRENMKAWHEHFANKYIICGKLVENDSASA